MKHTDTPWQLFDSSSVIAVDQHRAIAICSNVGGIDDQQSKANAAHIVRCVNSHDELVKALELIANQSRDGDIPQQVVRMQRIARAALAKARA